MSYYDRARRMGALILGSHLKKVKEPSEMYCVNCDTVLMDEEQIGEWGLVLDPNRPDDAICDCSWGCCSEAARMHPAHIDTRPVAKAGV